MLSEKWHYVGIIISIDSPPLDCLVDFGPFYLPYSRSVSWPRQKNWFMWEFEQENIHFSLIKSHVLIRSDHCLILSVIHSVTLSCRRQTEQSYTVSRRFVRMDALSGRYFLRTALDVLSGRHLSASLVKVVTCFCQSCCWIWSPFRVRHLTASPLGLWQCFLPRLLWRVEKENKWINENGALLSQWRGQTI